MMVKEWSYLDGQPMFFEIVMVWQVDQRYRAVITSLVMTVLVRPLPKEVHCLFDVMWGVASDSLMENAASPPIVKEKIKAIIS